jgi:hypothetical protein
MSFEIEISPNAFTSQLLTIDDHHVTYHDLQMELQEITGIRYGAVSKRMNGIEMSVSYYIGFLDTTEDMIEIKFSDRVFQINETEKIYNTVVGATWHHIGNRIMQDFVSRISKGETVVVGGFTCSKNGIEIIKKPLFGKEKIHTIKWNHVRHSIDNGFLNFNSAIDSDVYASIGISSRWNAVVLCEIFQQARTSRKMLDLLTGIQTA